MSGIFVVGLGSNLGERPRNLSRAVEHVARLRIRVDIEALSRVYESEALGPPQPDYLNAALRVSTDCDAERLLDGLLEIEREFGRVRDVRWGPRVLDLDILWGSAACATERLTVPHTQLRRRAFALAPLLDVAPELAPSYASALQDLGGSPVTRGLLCFDQSSGMCAFASAGVL